MQAPYGCPELTSYSWGSALTPYPIASLGRTICINPPRTRMESISSRRRCSAGFHNQRDNPSWVLPQDIPLHTRSITSIPAPHTAIFNGFSHRQNKRVITCLFLQVRFLYPIGRSNENIVPCSASLPSARGSRRNEPPCASTIHFVI